MESLRIDYEMLMMHLQQTTFYPSAIYYPAFKELVDAGIVKYESEVLDLPDKVHENVSFVKEELNSEFINSYFSCGIAKTPYELQDLLESFANDMYADIRSVLVSNTTSKREKLFFINEIIYDFKSKYDSHPLSENNTLKEILRKNEFHILEMEIGKGEFNKNKKFKYDHDSIYQYLLIQKSTFLKILNELEKYEKIVKKSDEVEFSSDYNLYPGCLKWRNYGDSEYVSEIVELVNALVLSNAIYKKDGALSVREALNIFGALFGIEIKDERKLLNSITKRHNTTKFIDLLRKTIINYSKEKAENRDEG